jgi:hypothetical protein
MIVRFPATPKDRVRQHHDRHDHGDDFAVRRQHLARLLHACGPRPVFEAMKEVAAGRNLDDVLLDYARIGPTVFHAVGTADFPSTARNLVVVPDLVGRPDDEFPEMPS